MTSDTVKKDFLWNTLGSAVYALSSVVLSFVAMRLLGSEDGGVFSFGFSTFGQQMFIIAYFGIRPFQITDVTGEYSFRNYEKARFLTVGLAVLFAVLYLSFFRITGTYTGKKALCILLLSLYKIADGYADCLESECQRKGVLWRGGRALFGRTVFCSGVLLAALWITGNVLASVAVSDLLQVLFCLFLRKRFSRDGILTDEKTGSGEKKLLQSTVFLFLGVFLDFFIFSSSKYAIDWRLSDSLSGIFNILFMPTNAIYLVANFIIKPFMTPMADAYHAGDGERFRKIRRKLTLLIGGLTVFSVAAVLLLGKTALGICEKILGDGYHGELTAHTAEFVLIIFGGGLYALANLSYYILVMKRKQREIFIVYLVTAFVALGLSLWLTGIWGITGAAVSYAALMSLLVAGFQIVD